MINFQIVINYKFFYKKRAFINLSINGLTKKSQNLAKKKRNNYLIVKIKKHPNDWICFFFLAYVGIKL